MKVVAIVASFSLAGMPILHNLPALYDGWAQDNIVYVITHGWPLPDSIICSTNQPGNKNNNDDGHDMRMMACHSTRPKHCNPQGRNVVLESSAGAPPPFIS